jgi:hypothetical protein
MSNKDTRATIVDYWRAVEFFLPQPVPKINNSLNGQPRVIDLSQNKPLPWEIKSQEKGEPDSVRNNQHQIFCGIYKIKTVRDQLIEVFSKDPDSFDKREDGESCLFVFSVDGCGRLLPDSFTISSCVWAVSRTLVSPGPYKPNWLEGFDSFAGNAEVNFRERLSHHQSSLSVADEEKDFKDSVSPITYKQIISEVELIAEELNVSEIFSSPQIRIRTVKSGSNQTGKDKTDFLNSFFLNDLKQVSREIRRGNYGNGLRQYLSSEEESAAVSKLDVRRSPHLIFESLAPDNFPSGRWANKGHHPLVSSQQFAVNLIFKELLNENGLFAVNGPPGTGKTTLLRDVIAGVLVERAKRLAALNRADDAFYGSTRLQNGQWTRTISLWREEFKGFEIVVASNNNGAVENVTMEIPGEKAVDPEWLDRTDYFAELATRILRNTKQNKDDESKSRENFDSTKPQKAWALIAARLGSKSNRSQFIDHGWHSLKDKKEKPEKIIEIGLMDILDQMNEPVDWKDAINRFNKALKSEQQLRTERSSYYHAFAEIQDLQRKIGGDESRRREMTKLTKSLQQKLEVQEQEIKSLINKTEILKKQRREHKEFEPSLIQIIFSLGRDLREWRKKDKELAGKIENAEQEVLESKTRVESTEKEIQKTKQNLRQIENNINEKETELEAKNLLVERAKIDLGEHFFLQTEWAECDEKERELAAPWSDRKWRDARALVFLEAINLHKAFIARNSKKILNNLRAVIDVLYGTVSTSTETEAVASAWTTLFFVIPVVSTTFASFDRLFTHLGRESLGWLFIDEAGQAVPQSAVGAIWRAKRSVVVGDPLQLEPIINVPFTLQQALRRHYKVEEVWLPGKTSVQQLADRVNRYGTEIRLEDNNFWVGSPLRVHRRCAREMFDVSNQIAYDGLMILAEPESTVPGNVTPSKWIHVEMDERKAIEHWIPAEGDAARELLNELKVMGIPMSEIFLVSPFRAVINELARIAKNYSGLNVGTVHTAQGKEKLIVILVLGSSPEKSGARKWAAEKPNLLNVAVSRARERLYIIGNYDLWRKQPYFETLAEKFPK